MPYSYKLGRNLEEYEWEYVSVANYISERTFVIADPHFGDTMEHLLKYSAARRELLAQSGQDSIDQVMVDRWNDVVGNNDLVLVLGDFTHETVPDNDIPEWTSQLRGKKILIKGNHDKEDSGIYKVCGWQDVITGPIICLKSYDYVMRIDPDDKNRPPHLSCIVVQVQGTRVMFSHVPIIHDGFIDVLDNFQRTCHVLETIFSNFACSVNVHGHTHEHDLNDPRCINASADKHDFTPIRIEEILKKK